MGTNHPSRLGQLVGGYALVERVADGPYATVYRGRKKGDADAAVKIYEASALGRRIQREAAAQKEVLHPCVAPLVGSGDLPDGARYLVSTFIVGERLEDRLARGTIDWHEIVPVVHAVGRGLAAIHAAGIVHRDVTPANVMLPAGGEPAAVILDFGHALVLDDERLTETGQLLGSASYSAPEQAAGRPLDGRAPICTRSASSSIAR